MLDNSEKLAQINQNIDVGYVDDSCSFYQCRPKTSCDAKPTVKVVRVDDLLGVFKGASNFRMI